MEALTNFEIRPVCPKCGMSMLSMNAHLECLRCGYVEKPEVAKPVKHPAD
jgi:ribosomal protein S27AE